MPNQELRLVDDVETAFAGGDLRAAYDAHGGLVYSYCRRCLGPETGREVTQEVFVSAWKSRHHFDPERGSLAGWLMAIAKNKVIDTVRAGNRRATTVTDEGVEPGAPATELENTADRMLVADALDRLPTRARQLVTMAFVEGMSHSEIADTTQIPLGTVKSDIRRGLLTMRRHLGELS